MKRLSNERRGGFPDSSKRQKSDVQNRNIPRRVVFIGGLPSDAVEADVIQLGLPFGRMTNLVFVKTKCQALLEMSDLESAEAMVQYYSERPPRLGPCTMVVRYSNYEELKTEPSPKNAGAAAALKAADELMDTADRPQNVLRIVIDNMIYPITLEVIHKIFSKFGQVVRIVTYMKNNLLHAFVEYANAVVATAAKNCLHGQNIYNGGCTLRVDFSNFDRLSVKFNNEKTWDYTNPDLPRGDERMMEHDFRSGVAPNDDMMRDRRMPSRGDAPGAAMMSRGRLPFDDDNDGDIDADFGPGAYGGNVRNASSFGGNVGPMGGNMEGMVGGMVEGGIMGSMMMNRMARMMGGGLPVMGGIGGIGGGGGGGGGIGPMGLMGSNLDGLSRLASDMGQMNVMRGNFPGMGGADGAMRGPMRRDESMERRRGSDSRMGRGGGPIRGRGGGPVSKRETSAAQFQESDFDGTVVLVSNMNEQRISPDSIFILFGVYGNVLRVKILYNKKDSALVEFTEPDQANNACKYLNGVHWWGKEIKVKPSTAKHVKLAKEGVQEPYLTKDFSDSDVVRFRTPNSKNYHNIFPPSATLHLSNIAANTSEEVLTELFGEYGQVDAFRFFQKDRKMALIQMGSVEDAVGALVELHNFELGPKNHLRVSFTNSTIRR